MTTRKNVATLAALFAVGSAAVGGSLLPAQAQNTPTPAPPVTGGHGERHPGLRGAIAHLERIKDNLQKDPKDFDGHKAKAIDLITQAQQELQQAIQSDKH